MSRPGGPDVANRGLGLQAGGQLFQPGVVFQRLDGAGVPQPVVLQPRQLARAGDRIFGYHLCDWLAETRDILLDRGMMGDGVADLRGIRAAVEGAGYAGPCEVEVFSAANWWKRDPEDVLATIVARYRAVC